MKNTVEKTIKITLVATAMSVALAACAGKPTPRARGITTVDKNMSCEQLMLEINDAEYIRQTALENRGLNARNILWPFGYPATYKSADDALTSAERRLGYLQKVYAIKKCERPLF